MVFTYKTTGTCSGRIHIEIEEDVIRQISFEGGCNGNLKGIAALCCGQKIDDVIEKLSGIRCGFKSTSCPDQLACALKEYKSKKGD